MLARGLIGLLCLVVARPASAALPVHSCNVDGDNDDSYRKVWAYDSRVKHGSPDVRVKVPVGGRVVTDLEGLLVSHSHNGNYRSGVECAFFLVAPPEYEITLVVTRMDGERRGKRKVFTYVAPMRPSGSPPAVAPKSLMDFFF